MEKNKKQTGVIIFLVICIVAIGTLLTLNYLKVIDLCGCSKQMDNCCTVTSKNDNDNQISARLISKTALLFTGNYKWKDVFAADLYLTNLLKTGVVDQEEIARKLLSNSLRTSYNANEITNESIKQQYGESIKEYSPEFIYESVLKYQYEDLFGNQNVKTYSHLEGCPSYYYDSNLKGYLEVTECGNVNTSDFIIYVDSTKEDESTGVVTLKVGYVEYQLGEEDYLTLYNDVEKTKVLKEKFDYNNDKINKDELSEYKVTFDKKNIGEKTFNAYADFYFNKIERIK